MAGTPSISLLKCFNIVLTSIFVYVFFLSPCAAAQQLSGAHCAKTPQQIAALSQQFDGEMNGSPPRHQWSVMPAGHSVVLWTCVVIWFQPVAAQRACQAGDTECMDAFDRENADDGYVEGDADFDDDRPSGRHRYAKKEAHKSSASLGALGGAFVADTIWSEVSEALGPQQIRTRATHGVQAGMREGPGDHV